MDFVHLWTVRFLHKISVGNVNLDTVLEQMESVKFVSQINRLIIKERVSQKIVYNGINLTNVWSVKAIILNFMMEIVMNVHLIN